MRAVIPRLVGVGAGMWFVVTASAVINAQAGSVEKADAAAPQHQHGAPPAEGAPTGHEGHVTPSDQGGHEGHVMAADHVGHEDGMSRDGSGTSWMPDASPMYAVHGSAGGWQLMAHGNAFVQFLHDDGDRGEHQGGSINWVMGMAQRPLGGGRFQLRGMLSLEPWTIPGCGYPDLLATGERCDGETIHDRQHPHDLVMEAAARYDAPLRGSVRWQIYGGPAGEPALGPVAFPHRLSAMPNPLAPIAHHWLDATHITFGVVTGAVYAARWKVEGSTFNGREPDERRTDLDLDALDSFSARAWFLPSPRWAFQVSAGRLTDAEPAETAGTAIDVTRVTASAMYTVPLGDDGQWATTVAWGRNAESGRASHAFLAETSVSPSARDTWYGRVEAVSKSAHDLLDDETDTLFTVAKLQGGYTREVATWRSLAAGVGGSLSAGIVPTSLQPFYGSRVNLGLGVYLTVHPRRMRM